MNTNPTFIKSFNLSTAANPAAASNVVTPLQELSENNLAARELFAVNLRR